MRTYTAGNFRTLTGHSRFSEADVHQNRPAVNGDPLNHFVRAEKQ
jgi:hypothetical protein